MADLHVHTSESDADLAAGEQVRRAAALGLASIWLTDHDVIRDAAHARALLALGKHAGVAVGIGVEMTVALGSSEHHLLGYFPDQAWTLVEDEFPPAMQELKETCARIKASRETRNAALVRHLAEVLGDPTSGALYFPAARRPGTLASLEVPVVAAWARSHAGLAEPASLGRPHFRAYLRDVVGVRDDLIFGPRDGDGRGLLVDGKVFFDPAAAAALSSGSSTAAIPIEALLHSATLARRNIAFEPLPAAAAITMITAAGGRAVLAHPPTLGQDFEKRVRAVLPSLADAGLWGIEAFSSEISAEHHAVIVAIAREYHLHLTGGSDNHGTLKPYAVLGSMHRAGSSSYEALDGWKLRGAHQSMALGGHDQDFVY